MFADAKPLTDIKNTKKEKPRHRIEGMSRLAALDAAIKSLAVLKAVEEANVKQAIIEKMVLDGVAAGARPANFKGFDDQAEGMCQIKSRPNTSALTVTEQALLSKHGLPMREATATVASFVINPEYATDMNLLKKVEDALSKIDLPEDFFLKQEATTKTIIAAETLDRLFATKDSTIIQAVLPSVGVVSVTPSMNEGEDCFAVIDLMMAIPEENTDEASEVAIAA
jgi:hypothetical protein